MLFVRKSTLTFALATLFGGIILFVSGLSWMDPQINPLVPVLKSPWLMFHVAVIVGAYGFFGISCLIGLTNLVMMSVSGEKNSVMLKEVVGTLLGLGPEGDVGVDYDGDICDRDASPLDTEMQ